MVILAIETVTRAGSVALCDDRGCDAAAGDPQRTHAERLPGEVTAWLGAHGRALADVDIFAVVSGPGSFTGLRIGIAAVQGFALASHRRVIGVPTLHALAASWVLADGGAGLVVPCLDGQRGDVFFAAMASDGTTPIEQCPEILAAAVGTPAEAAARVAAVAGDRRVIFVGDGARRYETTLTPLVPSACVVDAPMPLAAAAARLAQRRPDLAGAPHALRPIYVRRPDAVLARERAGLAAAPDEAGALVIGRAAGADDLKAVEWLQEQTFTNPWGADAIRWELENTDVARLYVARAAGGPLVAYCACWVVFDELHINSFAVDPAWRRRGIARALMHQVFGEAAAAGARAATLEVRESNVPARRLYEGLGFVVEGTRRDYYHDPREDALILWHRGLAAAADAVARKPGPSA